MRSIDQLLLQRATEALSEGNTVYAVIRGSQQQLRIISAEAAESSMLIKLAVPPVEATGSVQDVFIRPEDLLSVNVMR